MRYAGHTNNEHIFLALTPHGEVVSYSYSAHGDYRDVGWSKAWLSFVPKRIPDGPQHDFALAWLKKKADDLDQKVTTHIPAALLPI